ncbi:MAG: hypothetical protein LBK67_00595 [Coriobacteriales bacterium]|jgi:hypothetical protein|nr:hypothetical protein [Coriobacteriales bacterium]
MRLRLCFVTIALVSLMMFVAGLSACGQPTTPVATADEQAQTDKVDIPDDADCHGCHGTDAELMAVTSGYVTVDNEAVNPHHPVDRKETDPKQTHASTDAALLRCSVCHGTHDLPYDPDALTVKEASVSYCYRACHHQGNFKPCWECHED